MKNEIDAWCHETFLLQAVGQNESNRTAHSYSPPLRFHIWKTSGCVGETTRQKKTHAAHTFRASTRATKIRKHSHNLSMTIWVKNSFQLYKSCLQITQSRIPTTQDFFFQVPQCLVSCNLITWRDPWILTTNNYKSYRSATLHNKARWSKKQKEVK